MPLGQPVHRFSIGRTAEKSLVPGERRGEIADRDIRENFIDSHVWALPLFHFHL
jgi:hypothetical protein